MNSLIEVRVNLGWKGSNSFSLTLEKANFLHNWFFHLGVINDAKDINAVSDFKYSGGIRYFEWFESHTIFGVLPPSHFFPDPLALLFTTYHFRRSLPIFLNFYPLKLFVDPYNFRRPLTISPRMVNLLQLSMTHLPFRFSPRPLPLLFTPHFLSISANLWTNLNILFIYWYTVLLRHPVPLFSSHCYVMFLHMKQLTQNIKNNIGKLEWKITVLDINSCMY